MDEGNASRSEFSAAIVEDEKDLARMYQIILERMGVPLSFLATTGVEAIEMFRECAVKPQVVLMDNRLPRMSGIEATKVILGMEPCTRVVFLSGDIGMRDEAIHAGAASFISKPARISDIIEAIESAGMKSPVAGLLQREDIDTPVGSG